MDLTFMQGGDSALTFLWLADLFGKSVAIAGAFLVFGWLLRSRLSDASRHLLWLSCMICLGTLPFLPQIFELLPVRSTAESAAMFQLMVLPDAPNAAMNLHWSATLVGIYLLAVALLLLRLVIALVRIRQLRRSAESIDDAEMLAKLGALRQQFRIDRQTGLMFSDRIATPVSFGWFRPVILLPRQATEWTPSVTTDVLSHELSHVRRFDWLSTLFCHVVASVFWLNPLVWRVLANLNEEAENCCDSAVLYTGRNPAEYARTLLGLARDCAAQRRPRLLEQSMLDRNPLRERITQILEDKPMTLSELGKEIRRSTVVLLAVCATLLLGFGSLQMISAQTASERPDGEMLPLENVMPQYPSRAASEGIEGWVQVMFTVTSAGAVEEIRVVDAEPSEIFDASAIRAAERFRFQPRVRDGQAVAVPGVQYVFRYRLRDDENVAPASNP